MPPALSPGLYGIADASCADPVGLAIKLAAAGCPTVQLRAKGWTPQAVHRAAAAIAPRLRALKTCFIINDYPDIALAVGADGVHLGQEDAAIAQAREILGPDRMIGWSTHDLAQVGAAKGADYIGFGPVFVTQSKPDALPQRGTAQLMAAVQAAICPVVAIGGINMANLDQVRCTGVHGWACIGALQAADDLDAAVAALHA